MTGDPSLSDSHVCSRCGRSFPLRKTLYRHERTAHQAGQYLCTFGGCTEHFKRKDTRDRHVREQHDFSPASSVLCPICGRHVNGRALAGHQKSHRCRLAYSSLISFHESATARLQIQESDAEFPELRLRLLPAPSPGRNVLKADSPLLASISALFYTRTSDFCGDLGEAAQLYRTMALGLRGVAIRGVREHLQVLGNRSLVQHNHPSEYLAVLALLNVDCYLGNGTASSWHRGALQLMERTWPEHCSVRACDRLIYDAIKHCIERLPALPAAHTTAWQIAPLSSSESATLEKVLPRLCRMLRRAHSLDDDETWASYEAGQWCYDDVPLDAPWSRLSWGALESRSLRTSLDNGTKVVEFRGETGAGVSTMVQQLRATEPMSCYSSDGLDQWMPRPEAADALGNRLKRSLSGTSSRYPSCRPVSSNARADIGSEYYDLNGRTWPSIDDWLLSMEEPDRSVKHFPEDI